MASSDWARPGVRLRVAYSGGLDSHVLLHALADLRAVSDFRLSAIHIDHGLHIDSRQWAEHCGEVCRRLGVDCHVEAVEIRRCREAGLEAAARLARYAALARHIKTANDVLVTAHHKDDQVETLLLQLLRGAGVHGLAAMPAAAPFAAGRHARPLLGFRRRELARYAQHAGLLWIEDTSNLDTRIGRNFVRHRVLPLLEGHWPGATDCLARSAGHAADAVQLLDEIAALDESRCGGGEGTLLVGRLAALSAARQRNVLRRWIARTLGSPPPVPAVAAVLAQVAREPRTRHAAVPLPGGANVRRYRDRLWPVTRRARVAQAAVPWDPAEPFAVAGSGWRLRAVESVGAGISRTRIAALSLQVRLRGGGERLRPSGRDVRHRLKKLLQDAGVPPWQRRQIPLVYAGNELVAVGDRWVAATFAAAPHEPSLVLLLERDPPMDGRVKPGRAEQ